MWILVDFRIIWSLEASLERTPILSHTKESPGHPFSSKVVDWVTLDARCDVPFSFIRRNWLKFPSIKPLLNSNARSPCLKYITSLWSLFSLAQPYTVTTTKCYAWRRNHNCLLKKLRHVFYQNHCSHLSEKINNSTNLLKVDIINTKQGPFLALNLRTASSGS